MRRLAVVLAALALIRVLAIGAPAEAEPMVNENLFVALINQLRAQNGLVPLAPDPDMATVARNWSAVMARDNELKHNPNYKAQITDSAMLGENVGMGQSVAQLHEAFINSPHHYENLVQPKYDAVGIGIVEVGGTIWVTQNFKQRKTTAAVSNAGVKLPAAAPTAAPRPSAPASPKPTTAPASKPAAARPAASPPTPATQATSAATPAPGSPDPAAGAAAATAAPSGTSEEPGRLAEFAESVSDTSAGASQPVAMAVLASVLLLLVIWRTWAIRPDRMFLSSTR